MEEALIIFVKNPVKGKVKTRIAQTAGEDTAYSIYLSLLEHTRYTTLQVNADRLLFYSDALQRNDAWPEKQFRKYLQEGHTLGERMCNAFETAFSHYRRVVIIGSDCPGLSSTLIEQAFEQLREAPMVLGPARDGGYYLLGLQAHTPSLFEDIAWSTPSVLEQTMEKAAQIGLNPVLLPICADIDTEEDWQQFGWPL